VVEVLRRLLSVKGVAEDDDLLQGKLDEMTPEKREREKDEIGHGRALVDVLEERFRGLAVARDVGRHPHGVGQHPSDAHVQPVARPEFEDDLRCVRPP
jgi:hypothetical protein